MRQFVIAAGLLLPTAAWAHGPKPSSTAAVSDTECHRIWASADANRGRVLTRDQFADFYAREAQVNQRISLMQFGEPKVPFTARL
jgi:hypothetical protein